MKKGNLTKNLITGTITASLIFASAAGITTLSADTAANTTTGTSTTQKVKFDKGQRGPGLRQDVLEALQKEGVLTAEQLKTITERMEAAGKEDMTKKLSEQLAALVEKGTITSEQSTKITAFIEAKNAERQAEMDKIKAMTEAERQAYMDKQKAERDAEREKIAAMTDAEKKAYFEAKKSEHKDMLTEMVEAGIITQTQADALKEVMPMGKGGMEKGKMRPDSQKTDTNTTVQ